MDQSPPADVSARVSFAVYTATRSQYKSMRRAATFLYSKESEDEKTMRQNAAKDANLVNENWENASAEKNGYVEGELHPS